MPQHRGSPPQPPDPAAVAATASEQNWVTVPPELTGTVSAAFDTMGMSADIKTEAKRIFTPRQRRLTLVPRVDMRGVDHTPRIAARPRERRAAHSRRRRTTTSRDDGSSPGSDEPAPGRRTAYSYGLSGYRKAVAS